MKEVFELRKIFPPTKDGEVQGAGSWPTSGPTRLVQ
jgi:hypothetical protein